ncbi:MAG: hypothetical protein A3I76_01240 [Elusimicrobia bacterium RIFCSPLOWO2_02_FULL_61_11]|nr:MAG: hypothetical protein A3I76_01240 [Elusimicrobia bacterium RIFCSPLOWO2_02_FULL_61_11]
MGSSMKKPAPPPGLFSAQILPLCPATMPKEMDRPRPVPFPGSLVVKKGSKILSMQSAGIPGPLSATSTRMKPPIFLVLMDRSFFPSWCSIESCALPIRFMKTCWSWWKSAMVLGRLASSSLETEIL